ncbi:DEAD/DEAH box helicase [Flavobacterium sp. GP15]|uniref:DEAD/DEAH box helicase n=1 Tax=Flavobacterium sp. GP15 TaxID=2758567 RepID=UPI00165E1053|nr:DEAD/DEAH box helicase [Flavobacterium sp. GP15]
MEIKQITLKEFRKEIKSTFFDSSYKKLQLNLDLNETEIHHLLKNAIIFSNFGDSDLQKLAYKIIVTYSNKYNDYKPLYDFAINKGYIPISKLVESKYSNNNIDDHFFNLFFSSFQENFKEKNYYISNGQKKLIEFSSNNNSNFVLIAPTSYGKSEIIVEKVLSNKDKKVCIIVPSKALLAQTKKRLLNNSNNSNVHRIITHPEMYKGTEQNFIAVLTQERLLRLLQKNIDLKLDIVLIDEAHNLFGEKEDDSRSILLAQVIIILKKRNENVVLNFFSPFIANPNNLKIKQCNYDVASQNTDEFIKTEKYFVCDLYESSGKLEIFDQFSNSFINTNIEYKNVFDLLKLEKSNKNIIYLNRPIHIEEFSLELANRTNDIELQIEEIEKTISEYIHPDYNLIKCIKKGIVYHHGGMPEIIRLFVEDIFSKRKDLEFVITSSTLLEGVNIPAEKIFLFSTIKGKNTNLSTSQFKNLIGRINRFSEIFNPESGDLKLLEPNVYIVKSKYSNKKANIKKFISDRAKTESISIDNVNNLLLKDEENLSETQKISLKNSLEFLENIEPNSTNLEGIVYVQSEIAQLCFKNNVYDFDIKQSERTLLKNLAVYKSTLFTIISDSNQLIEAIYSIFFKDVLIVDANIIRLQNPSARRFYAMILQWRSSSASYNEMIGSFINYWRRLSGDELIIYVGTKWGKDKRNFTDHQPLYINLKGKETAERVNIAIIRIKEEQDYVEFNLLKYTEILGELGLIENDFYEQIKYGSSDKKIITLLKNGFSIELAKCITKEEYLNFISINHKIDEIIIKDTIVIEMEINNENKILIFEIKYHINEQ